DSGAIIRPDLIQHETAFFHPYTGEYSKLIKALVENKERNRQIVSDIVDMTHTGHEGTVLLVSDRVAHCEVLLRKLQTHHIITELLTGRVLPGERGDIVRRVRDGEIQVLLSTLQLISEGFDCPGLSTLVLATPIRFEGRLMQVVGRIMRPAQGKKALVVDYVDVKIAVLHRSGFARAEMFSRWRHG
ncbi:MAG: ATP-dependent helicase, partial [Candidatus Electrothrix sp. AR4]|nr:ATP-dependent helicase [Candidatus Electrothrix sp. AR4]